MSKEKRNKVLKYIVLIALAVIVLMPVIFMVINTFMSSSEINGAYNFQSKHFISLRLIPEKATLSQYYSVLLNSPEYLVKFWNSCALVIPLVIGQVLISIPAAFALSRFEFRYKKVIIFTIVLIMLLPYQAILVPNYIVLDKLKLIGNNLAIILPGMFSALGVFILMQYMKTIPKDIIESAKVDGASYFTILVKMIIPQCKGGIAALTLLAFSDSWNMIEQPITFLNSMYKYPLSVFLSKINNEDIGIAFVCGVLYMIPVIILFLLLEKYLLDGMKNIELK